MYTLRDHDFRETSPSVDKTASFKDGARFDGGGSGMATRGGGFACTTRSPGAAPIRETRFPAQTTPFGKENGGPGEIPGRRPRFMRRSKADHGPVRLTQKVAR
jgi:hypothetical protein